MHGTQVVRALKSSDESADVRGQLGANRRREEKPGNENHRVKMP
jgi:hypothetical protein